MRRVSIERSLHSSFILDHFFQPSLRQISSNTQSLIYVAQKLGVPVKVLGLLKFFNCSTGTMKTKDGISKDTRALVFL